MGRKLAKKPKLNLNIYNDIIESYINKGYDEDRAIEKANYDCFSSTQYEYDMSDPVVQAILNGGIQQMMIEKSLEEEEDD